MTHSVETCRIVIIYEIIVNLLVIVQNNKKCTVRGINTNVKGVIWTAVPVSSPVSTAPCFEKPPSDKGHSRRTLYCRQHRRPAPRILITWRYDRSVDVVLHNLTVIRAGYLSDHRCQTFSVLRFIVLWRQNMNGFVFVSSSPSIYLQYTSMEHSSFWEAKRSSDSPHFRKHEG